MQANNQQVPEPVIDPQSHTHHTLANTRKISPLPDKILFGVHIGGQTKYNMDTPSTWARLMSPLNPGSGYGEFVAIDQTTGLANKASILEKAKQVHSAKGFFLLTIEPHHHGLDELSDPVIDKIVTILAEISALDVPLLLRPMHEMNGSWYKWGQKPIKYKDTWIRLAKAVRIRAPQTTLVWSPNVQIGYPFGPERMANTNELNALDTNRDGVVNANDDPFSPYYPGHEYVDWIGISVFHFGPYPFGRNKVPSNKYLAEVLDPILRFVNSDQCRGGGRPKPFGIFETGAAYYPVSTDGQFDKATGLLGERMNVDMKVSWLKQLTSIETRMLGVALVMWFECAKDEVVDGVVMERDFAISRDLMVLQAVKAVLAESQTTLR